MMVKQNNNNNNKILPERLFSSDNSYIRNNYNQDISSKQNNYIHYVHPISNYTYSNLPNHGGHSSYYPYTTLPQPNHQRNQNQNHVMTTSEWFHQQGQNPFYWQRQQRSCVMLFEFCQFHKLPNPNFVLRSNNDNKNKSYWFDCIIGERVFSPRYCCDKCWYQIDAIDYISIQVFTCLFSEYKQKTNLITRRISRGFQDNKLDCDPRFDDRSKLDNVFHKELEEYQRRKKNDEAEKTNCEEEVDRGKNQLPARNTHGNSNTNPFFMGNVPAQPPNHSGNLFQPMANNQPKSPSNFGGFVQQQKKMQSVLVPSTLNDPTVQAQNTFPDFQTNHVRSSVPLSANAREQVQIASSISPATADVMVSTQHQEGERLQKKDTNENQKQQKTVFTLDISSIEFDASDASTFHSAAEVDLIYFSETDDDESIEFCMG